MLFVKEFREAPSVQVEFSMRRVLNIVFGAAPYEVLHWQAICGSRNLLHVDIDRASGVLCEVSLITIDQERVTAVSTSHFLGDGEPALPVFDRSPWPREISDPFEPFDFIAGITGEEIGLQLAIGESDVAVEIGEPTRTARICQVGPVRIGFDSLGQLCRIDMLNVSPSELEMLHVRVFESDGYLPPQTLD